MVEKRGAVELHGNTMEHLHHRMIDTVCVVSVTGQDKGVSTHHVVAGEPG